LQESKLQLSFPQEQFQEKKKKEKKIVELQVGHKFLCDQTQVWLLFLQLNQKQKNKKVAMKNMGSS
jgi:hypothetical protein